ncbi:TOM1-like protein 9 isoform X2 [Impatiens glandulifera]|nr:TOM1-like protein 9 isoform X2 [Impatiens glandulifera]
MQVAEKDLLHDMVKIVKKKPDFHVKEKILILVDTWQEAFGGARARYPQYFAAYQELLRAGAVFPQRSERAAPVFTPPQSQPLASHPQNLRIPENQQEAAEPSAEAEFPSLSLTEIQNARGIMDVLAEMLNAIDPGNKEGLRQEVIVDLVAQCRTYKQRVVHLVNSTSDESLLCQGLSLNDDLQRLLARHEAIASGTPAPREQLKPESDGTLVKVDGLLIDTGDNKKQAGSASSSNAGVQLLVPASSASNPKMDLLSGDDFSSPTAKNSLAIVPVGGPQPNSPVANSENALALLDMFPQSNNSQSVSQPGQAAYPSTPPSYPPQQQQILQSSQTSVYTNGAAPNTMVPQYEQQSLYNQGANPAWNGHVVQQQQQQPASPVYGGQSSSSSSLPPPPWESQQTEDSNNSQLQPPPSQYPQPPPPSQYPQLPPPSQYPQPPPPSQYSQPQSMLQVQVTHQPMAMAGGGMYMHHHHHPLTENTVPSMNMNNNNLHPQFIARQQQMYSHPQMQMQQQMGGYNNIYPQQQQQQQMYGQQMGGFGYGGYNIQQPQHNHHQHPQFLDQRMSNLSVRDDSTLKIPTPSYIPPGKPMKAEDKLFGDLVDINKFKPSSAKATTTPGRAGTM